MRLILASGSPRRRQLLEEAGLRIHVHPPESAEPSWQDGSARAYAASTARHKAEAVVELFPNDVVLAADTVVTLEGVVYGKPADHAEATAMLRTLSGKIHEVITAVCFLHANGNRQLSFEDFTRVKFRTLTDPDIAAYFEAVNPLDKAGGYAAQEDGGRLIEKIEGSLTNVIGLPMERVLEAIRRHFPEFLPSSTQNLP